MADRLAQFAGHLELSPIAQVAGNSVGRWVYGRRADGRTGLTDDGEDRRLEGKVAIITGLCPRDRAHMSQG